MSSDPDFYLSQGVLLGQEAKALGSESLIGNWPPALARLGLIFGFPTALARLRVKQLLLFVIADVGFVVGPGVCVVVDSWSRFLLAQVILGLHFDGLMTLNHFLLKLLNLDF